MLEERQRHTKTGEKPLPLLLLFVFLHRGHLKVQYEPKRTLTSFPKGYSPHMKQSLGHPDGVQQEPKLPILGWPHTTGSAREP